MLPNLHAPTAIPAAREKLEAFLKERAADGAEFAVGETIQVGWMWFIIEEQGIAAPQMGVMPMAFDADCSVALNLVITQSYLCDSFDLPYSFCDARQAALTIKGLGENRQVYMNRQNEADGHDSGWFFGASDNPRDPNDAGNLEWRSLWELTCLFPTSLEFFLLPPGHQVKLDGNPAVMRDLQRLTAKPDSYYAGKYLTQ